MNLITSRNPIQMQAWLESLRPKTLPLGIAPIITGSALAYWYGAFTLSIALLALLTAAALQILSNLANDYGDAVKGSDTEQRLGPLRGIQKGIISLAEMKVALKITIFFCCLFGLTLIIVAGKTPKDIVGFLILGVIAITAAITYTVGKKPYGYLGLGDVSVLIFFGWLSVIGTYYLHTNHFNLMTLLPATACGLLSVAVLNVNNMRDIENDIKAGKNTLAVRLGAKGARQYHAALILIAIFCLILFSLLYLHHWTGWLFLLAMPMLLKHIKKVIHDTTAEGMKPLLENMVKAALLTNILFSVGLILN